MGQWHKTGCALCPPNCGLEVEVENKRIVKVRGDTSNVRSEGYVPEGNEHSQFPAPRRTPEIPPESGRESINRSITIKQIIRRIP
jgi:anaerobic selenocysteine-containing dehydrogenase